MNVMPLSMTSCIRISDKVVYENGQLVDSNIQMGNYTSYPSAFLVVDPDGIYSKHYYAGTQRIAARIGDKNADELFADKKKSAKLNGTDSTDNTFNAEELKTLQQKDLQLYLDKAGKVARLSFKKYKSGESEVQEQQQENENNYVAYGAMAEELIYYYHPDHLGTATYLTDINGEAYEFFLNLPFGETMAEQHSQTADYVNRWKFTGHELDRETGLYYANARYYDPKLSIFISVDPLAEKFYNRIPYEYCFSNPINLIDPTGMGPDDPPLKNIIINFLRDDVGSEGNRTGNFDNDDLAKNGWHVIDVDTMEEAATELGKYLGDQKADNIFINTHGGVAKDGNGGINVEGISILGSNIEMYNNDCDRLNRINSSKEGVIESLSSISGMLNNDGNLIFAACYADRGNKIGTELSKMNPEINVFLSGDYSSVTSYKNHPNTTTYKHFFDTPRISASNFKYGMSKYKGGEQVSTGFNMILSNSIRRKGN